MQKKAGGSVTHITNYSLEHMLEVLNYWGKFHTEFLIYSCSDIIQGRKWAINICKKKRGEFHTELNSFSCKWDINYYCNYVYKKVGVVCRILPYLRKVGNYPTYRNMTNTVKFILNTIYQHLPSKRFWLLMIGEYFKRLTSFAL